MLFLQAPLDGRLAQLSMVRSAPSQVGEKADSCTLFIKPQTQRKGQISFTPIQSRHCTSENNVQGDRTHARVCVKAATEIRLAEASTEGSITRGLLMGTAHT